MRPLVPWGEFTLSLLTFLLVVADLAILLGASGALDAWLTHVHP